jgi:transcriptional regulator with XRE-family HTH domain
MASPRTPGGFGSRLRDTREGKGITLRQIANATKISMRALEALERNDISRLPGGIFTRAFVRSYAIEVGLEPEETIRDFIAQFPQDSVTAGHPTSAHIGDNDALESDRRTMSAFLRLIVFSLPIAGGVLYFSTAGRLVPNTPAEPASQVVSPAPLESAAAPSLDVARPSVDVAQPSIDVAQPVAARADAAVRADRLMVGLATTGPCWVSATVDGERVLERQLPAGDHRFLEVRRELLLTAGDAGALSLTLNGASARPLGKSGAVVTMSVNLTNFKDYLAAP